MTRIRATRMLRSSGCGPHECARVPARASGGAAAGAAAVARDDTDHCDYGYELLPPPIYDLQHELWLQVVPHTLRLWLST